MSDQSETSPLTFESLQSAMVEARDNYYAPEVTSNRIPIRRERYDDRMRYFESIGDELRIDLLKTCYQPIDVEEES